MKILLLLFVLLSFSAQAADKFYYTSSGWFPGPWPEDNAKVNGSFVSTSNGLPICEVAILDEAGYPVDIRLTTCDATTKKSRLKTGSALTDAQAIIDAEKAALLAQFNAMKDLDFGKQLKAYIKTIESGITIEQLDAFYLDADIALIQRYLDNGRIDGAKTKIEAKDMTPFGFTAEKKSAIVKQMTDYLAK